MERWYKIWFPTLEEYENDWSDVLENFQKLVSMHSWVEAVLYEKRSNHTFYIQTQGHFFTLELEKRYTKRPIQPCEKPSELSEEDIRWQSRSK